MFCPFCGNGLSDQAKFCPVCGKAVGRSDSNSGGSPNGNAGSSADNMNKANAPQGTRDLWSSNMQTGTTAPNMPTGNASQGMSNGNPAQGMPLGNASQGMSGRNPAQGIPGVNAGQGVPVGNAAQGMPLGNASQAKPAGNPAQSMPNGNYNQDMQNASSNAMPFNNVNSYPDVNTVEQRKKKPILLILGIIGIVVIAAVIVAVAVFSKASKNTEFEEKMDLGRKYFSELDYEQAVLAFMEAIEIDPKNTDAYIQLAETYSKMGDNKKARDILTEGLNNIDDDNEVEKIKKLMSQYSDSYSELVERARKLFEAGKNSEAITEYERAIDIAPKEYAAYVGLFDVYVSEVKYTAAGIVVDSGLNSVESTSGRMQLETCRSRLKELTGSELVLEPTPEVTSGPEVTPEPVVTEIVSKQDILMNIRQIDNSNYPEMVVYADITDMSGNNIDNLGKYDIVADEIDTKGNIHHVDLKDVIKIIGEEKISINLVIDKSGSMTDYNSMQQVKNAVYALINYMDLDDGDCMEIISFDDYVYLNQEFTTDEYKLKKAVDSLYPEGMTSLYDAIYSALYQAYYADGARCVVAFTDGLENNSSYTYNDVASLAKSTGIPVYIVGVGGEYDSQIYTRLADECGGAYYSASRTDIERVLTDIYINLYTEQRDYYVLRYNTSNTKNTKKIWALNLSMSESSAFEGECSKSFQAEADLAGAFSDKYYNVDYILPFSASREIKESDLKGLTLAQLRIARNEIFARHGRQFKDTLLNQWFYSKSWYLSIANKYSPDYFDKYSPSPLSSIENKNADFISKYEKKLMASQDIFPNANIIELSEYDLALTKSVLKTALSQMEKYPDSQILQDNIKKVKEAIKVAKL